ncbi:hypothetical protein CHARACLAT_029717 [Characodon lateralis]|uniref:Uncharacterized protein n=1 Tax=Characodon lateralis TaxID=208331 RepID=A0ABU7EFS9_9TELE|nr:hypothetical protein [Characodon lateralis]
MLSEGEEEECRPLSWQSRGETRKSWRTSSRDHLQGNGVPSPVVGQIGVIRCVLLLHADYQTEARLNWASLHWALLAACAICCCRCHVHQRKTSRAVCVCKRERGIEERNVCIDVQSSLSLPSLFLLALHCSS